jgi:hypothetical protein
MANTIDMRSGMNIIQENIVIKLGRLSVLLDSSIAHTHDTSLDTWFD